MRIPSVVSHGRMTIQGGGALRGLGSFWDDLTGAAVSQATAAGSQTGGDTIPAPSGKAVPLSPDMTYAQRITYAEAGYWALQTYLDVSGFLLDDTITSQLQDAQQAYYDAYQRIRQNLGTYTADQLTALQHADVASDIALSNFDTAPAVRSPNPAPALAKAAATIPPAGQRTAPQLQAAQSGGLGTLGWLALGIAAVVFGPKIYKALVK